MFSFLPCPSVQNAVLLKTFSGISLGCKLLVHTKYVHPQWCTKLLSLINFDLAFSLLRVGPVLQLFQSSVLNITCYLYLEVTGNISVCVIRNTVISSFTYNSSKVLAIEKGCLHCHVQRFYKI